MKEHKKKVEKAKKMSISICVSLLVLVAVCLNLKSSVSANSLASTHKNDSNISPTINVLGISISNDLPPGPTKLFFFADFQKSQVEIRPGNGNRYIKLLNMENHTGGLRWKQYATFSVIPSLEKGHQRIYWSVREDGLYHSWDTTNWDKREFWNTC